MDRRREDKQKREKHWKREEISPQRKKSEVTNSIRVIHRWH